jgi:transketolase
MFAAHHGLSALTVVVDLNGSQALGKTHEILRIEQRALWQALGWNVIEVDGHDAAALLAALGPARTDSRSVVAPSGAPYGATTNSAMSCRVGGEFLHCGGGSGGSQGVKA